MSILTKRAAGMLVVIVAAWLLAWAVAARMTPAPVAQQKGERLDPAKLRNVEIAPLSEALTFARFEHGGRKRLLRVSEYRDGRVRGVDFTAQSTDPVSLFNALGYDAIARGSRTLIEVDAEQLVLPFDGTSAQIAMGANYPEHGQEVDVADVFIFPKMTQATGPRATVPAREHLLDYEVELGFVALEPIRRGELPKFVGLILSSDYTDRAELMRHLNLRDVPSGDGFTRGKSAPGFMPLGNLLVIPRNWQSYYRTLRLQLWRDGELRQAANPNDLIWDFPRMLGESFARENQRWEWNGKPVALPIANGAIPARTVILSGTPGGVIFTPPTPRQLFLGVSESFFLLHWNRPQAILEPTIRDHYRSGRYLQPGESVVMHADRLGQIVNRIGAGR